MNNKNKKALTSRFVVLPALSFALLSAYPAHAEVWERLAAKAVEEGLSLVKSQLDARYRHERFLSRLGLFDFAVYDRFEPIKDPQPQLVVTGRELNPAQEHEVRSGLVLSRHGYLDYSDLSALGAIDTEGYVQDIATLYGHVGTQIEGLGSQRLNWSQGEIDFAQSHYEVVRVLEAVGDGSLSETYQANVSLLRDLTHHQYIICVGGTTSIEDIKTDVILGLTGETGAHGVAVNNMVNTLFAQDIPRNAVVNLAGHSLGGAAVLELYQGTPERFNTVYHVQGAGYGGQDGSYYERHIWQGEGDANIIEIFADDPDPDDNEMTTFWGFVGSGTLYDLSDVLVNVGESEIVGPDSEFFDSHWIGNLWASLDSL